MYRRIITQHTRTICQSTTPFTPATVNAIHVPLCKNCIHFKPITPITGIQLTPYYGEEFLKYGTCDLFGELDLVTGAIKKEYASVARRSRDMCGCHAHYYQEHESQPKTPPPPPPDNNYPNKKYDDSILS
jgi:hypothetical protein